MTRVAIYARYSSDNQKDASIEDQVRICREKAEKEGWSIVNVYTDHAISGASMIRPGIQQLMTDIMSARVDVVLAEALDRFSRDQADIATFYKRAQFSGVAVHTLSEGEITTLHIGLKGTMNALFLKDLKDKVKRGQRGRVENGKMGGGNCYGYDVVKKLDDRGELVRGERAINPEQARIVERIFREYAAGKSPKAIANALNAEGIPAPTSKGWGPSTIYGNWQRGAGILNNELYAGQIVWNKVSYPKNPDTGRHVTRINPESEWVRKEVPELRIISQELWDKVKRRQRRGQNEKKEFWEHQRPRYIFSYLLKCGCCGGGMSKISKAHYGCSTARNKGEALCSNLRTIRQEILEETVLGILRKHLMDPKLVAIFCEEYTTHVNHLRMEHNGTIGAYRSELEKLTRRERSIIKAIGDGYYTPALKEEGLAIDKRKTELERLLAGEREAPTLLHPNMASVYRREVQNLLDSLRDDENRHEALELVRGLVERIVLTPDPNSEGLLVNLYGDLAGILKIAMGMEAAKKEQQEIDLKHIRLVVGLDDHRSTTRWQGKLVGPAGLEPATRPL